MVTKVKICGLTRIQDVEAAEDFGADAVGFVMEPSSPRFVGGIEDLRILARGVGPYSTSVAVFGDMPDITEFDLGVQAIQALTFHDGIKVSYRRIATVRIGDGAASRPLDQLRATDSALLVDAFHPEALGGTGTRVDWNLAAEIVAACPKPVILAGGLTPENVSECIRIVRPYGVDVSSGVEISPGIKDPLKIRDFIQAAKASL